MNQRDAAPLSEAVARAVELLRENADVVRRYSKPESQEAARDSESGQRANRPNLCISQLGAGVRLSVRVSLF